MKDDFLNRLFDSIHWMAKKKKNIFTHFGKSFILVWLTPIGCDLPFSFIKLINKQK